MKRGLSLLLSAILCSASIIAGAADNKVLNEIVIGETVIDDYLQSLDKKGCQYGTKNWAAGLTAYSVGSVCYNLPKLESVNVIPGLDKKVIFVEIVYHKDIAGKTFMTYFDALKKNYGSPLVENIPFVGSKKAEFKTGDMSILLNEAHFEPTGIVLFMPAKIWDQTKQKEAEQKANDKKDLETLL